MQIEVIARALILNGDKILLTHAKSKKYTYLPGGHVKYGEFTEEALKRELQEELGVSTEIIAFVGVLEYKYKSFEGETMIFHELNLIFYVKISGAVSTVHGLQSKEKRLEFIWVPIKKLKDYNLLPAPLITLIPSWINSEKPFFQSSFSEH